jgi:hypothetical protein
MVAATAPRARWRELLTYRWSKLVTWYRQTSLSTSRTGFLSLGIDPLFIPRSEYPSYVLFSQLCYTCDAAGQKHPQRLVSRGAAGTMDILSTTISLGSVQ